jgi:hypothetical protein
MQTRREGNGHSKHCTNIGSNQSSNGYTW